MAAHSVDTDVIVVGAGPVGLMLAGELRTGGARVTVLERLAEPTTESRASTLHARTMEIFEQRGLLDELGTVPHDTAGHFGGIRLDFGGLDSPYRGLWKVPQADTERLLGSRAAGLGAVVRRGHELVELRQTESGVEAEAAGPGGTVRIRASHLVGCDGENSAVRRLGGFPFPGTDATRELLRADVAGIDVPDRRFERHEHGMAVAHRRPDGITRVMVHEFGKSAAARAGEPEFAEVAAAWARVTGEDITAGRPVWVNAFGNARRLAGHYRDGRVLLAGDAAHVQMPVGGQALNLGLQDAVNLGWKLAAQVRGTAPAGLLDSYHDERHAVGSRVLANIEAQALLLLGGPEVEPLRAVVAELLGHDEAVGHLAGMISGLDVRYPGEDDDPLAGRRAPYWEPAGGDGAARTAELLRTGRGVLLDFTAGLSPGAVAGWADRVGMVPAPAPHAPASGPPAGPGGRPVRAVLIRPDGHVAWADYGSAQLDTARLGSARLDTGRLDTALRRWFGAPAHDRAAPEPAAGV
ncbi:NAD-binding protein [Streptomyces sp. HNM0575]|uniref:FAD-dependent monooxygenase n=1 Tax=Streptomyces sp. HNM0575 TaxID=2716338 RepID=UPI00145F6DE0|nr:FAD-dependent monooxygenase [Streptomyces sp. HNM0575]NLU74340.1 NAD-binding protein [Streptomyces sp. HNM0575]